MKTDVLQRLIELREQKARLEEALKETSENIDFVQGQVIESMLEEEITSMKYNGYSFSPGMKVYASVAANSEGIQWLKDRGMADIVSETVHAQRLSSFVKEYMSEHNILTAADLPEDFRDNIKVYDKPTLSIRAAK